MTATERFWSKVKHRTSGCWEWTGAMTRSGYMGYGRLRMNSKYYLAHRVSYKMEYGSIPNGLCVCHTCDNRKCVRPSHLFLRTQKDNMVDCSVKGRIAKGSRSAKSKLTETQVKTIHKDKRLHKEIAKAYGVDRSIISKIKGGKIWKHIK